MALRGLLTQKYSDISAFCNETAEQGQVLVWSTSGSGQSLDDPNAVVAIPTVVSGSRPAGVLLSEVVNLDLTRTHLNQYQLETQLGSKVNLLTQGEIVTNLIETGNSVSPTAGDDAYYTVEDSQGKFTTVIPTDTDVEDHTYKVGQFRSKKDSDGYAKILINI